MLDRPNKLDPSLFVHGAVLASSTAPVTAYVIVDGLSDSLSATGIHPIAYKRRGDDAWVKCVEESTWVGAHWFDRVVTGDEADAIWAEYSACVLTGELGC